MSVSIMEIGRSTNGSRLPLDSYVEPYGETGDHLALPFNVLWEQARSGITKFVHFSYKNLHQILGKADMEIVPQNNDILQHPFPALQRRSTLESSPVPLAAGGLFSSQTVWKSA